jgi:hypothetical protein
MSGDGAVAPAPRSAPVESRATIAALDSYRLGFDTGPVDKGKPVERRGRKATGLKDGSYDGGAASIARRRERSHSPSAFRAESFRLVADGRSGEFMTPTANLAAAGADAEHAAAPAAEAGSFVLNLCSSTTPMALPQTDLPELRRFTFFVSRRFEEGRERFRLHMGFFASQAEAEEWLAVVREIYPGAWAGEAPGKKLRARAAEAAAVQARHAVGPQLTAAQPTPAQPPSAPRAAQRPSAPPAASVDVLKRVPTLHPPVPAQKVAAAPSAPRPIGASAAKAAPARQPVRTVAGGTAPIAAKGAPVRSAAPAMAQVKSPAPPQTPAATRPAQARPAPPASAAAPMSPATARTQQPAAKPVFVHSNVREVLAALDTPQAGAGQTRLMPAPMVPDAAPADDSSLTDTQVLKFLETRREAETASVDPAASGISLLKPDDTGTRRALKEAVSQQRPVSFAVQLYWSVQPVELDKVPPLAIFSAYTLYSVAGSRGGRRWYGLRLGFFNDAISAKQVAYYVRSEFASVAVVPVSAEERERATDDNQRFADASAAKKRRESMDNEFKLIDEEPAPPAAAPAGSPQPALAPAQRGAPAQRAAPAATRPVAPQTAPSKAAQAAPQAQSASARAGRKAGGGKVGARERRTPQTLEETLEILGANELAIDHRSGDVSDSGVRHLRVEYQKNTPFSRLLERLSERVRKT